MLLAMMPLCYLEDLELQRICELQFIHMLITHHNNSHMHYKSIRHVYLQEHVRHGGYKDEGAD